MTRDKLKKFLRVDDGVEIDLSQNGDIIIKGFKNDVQQAKDEITSEILKTNVDFQSKLLKIDPKIRWQCKNESNEWVSFSLFLNGLIEISFNDGIKQFETQSEANKLREFDMNNMSMLYDSKKWLLRRLDDTINESKTIASDVSITNNKFPNEWLSMSEFELYKVVEIDSNSDEFKKVNLGFTSTFGRILKIERLQNPRLYQQYEIHRDYLRKKNGNENERILYHGTSSTNIDSICKFGFNRSYCGVNGVAYGKGVYFAVNSSYSHSYTRTDSDSKRYMFQCRVLIGDSIRGDSSMNVPPKKSNGEPYDSTCDASRLIFVCYNDNQCYPEYLITYS